MSYEISNHIFLGISVAEFAEELTEEKSVDDIAEITWDIENNIAEVKEIFSSLVDKGLLTKAVFNDEADEEGKKMMSFAAPSIKKALLELLEKHKQAGKAEEDYEKQRKAYPVEKCIKLLMQGYISSLGFEVFIEVVSTYYSSPHDLGGMETDVPYIAYEGMDLLDENGWSDPRDDDPEFYEDFRSDFLGNKDFQKYTPQFGG